jgi:pimeloyl-ACP methyl ester carboxylesterase
MSIWRGHPWPIPRFFPRLSNPPARTPRRGKGEPERRCVRYRMRTSAASTCNPVHAPKSGIRDRATDTIRTRVRKGASGSPLSRSQESTRTSELAASMIVASLISRGFLRPSHHYIPCSKEEHLVDVPWGKVQLWREYSGERGKADTVFVRFLGSRGRAEMATLDPADRLNGRSADVWTVNPPSFGGTSGPPNLEHYADCALAAAAYVAGYSESRPLWICGKSIGTAAALLVAANMQIAGLILRNAMPLPDLLKRHYALRTLGLSRLLAAAAIPRRLDSLSNAQNARAAALFLVSKHDTVVPPIFQHQLIAAYAGPKVVLEVSGGHDERALQPNDEAAYRQALCRAIST